MEWPLLFQITEPESNRSRRQFPLISEKPEVYACFSITLVFQAVHTFGDKEADGMIGVPAVTTIVPTICLFIYSCQAKLQLYPQNINHVKKFAFFIQGLTRLDGKTVVSEGVGWRWKGGHKKEQ